MRTARLLGRGTSYYHCVSRIIEGKFRLNNKEKERFRKTMRKVAGFCGVKIMTHALMSNHVHLMVMVPEKCIIPEEEVLRRIAILYGKDKSEEIAEQLKEYHSTGYEQEAETLLKSYTYRMHDLSQFMKSVMQKFTQSYNKRHDRRGHLWENRFKSTLIEGKPNAISTMAAYIDLNPVRAGIVDDPKDYRFTGYGEAVAGKKDAKCGIQIICEILGQNGSWDSQIKFYRKHLFTQADVHDKKGNKIDMKKIQEVLDNGGKLSRIELIHCKVRYLTDGAVLGSQNFVEDVFEQYRDQFGLKRKTGARKPRFADWQGLFTMRDLRSNPITTPSPPT